MAHPFGVTYREDVTYREHERVNIRGSVEPQSASAAYRDSCARRACEGNKPAARRAQMVEVRQERNLLPHRRHANGRRLLTRWGETMLIRRSVSVSVVTANGRTPISARIQRTTSDAPRSSRAREVTRAIRTKCRAGKYSLVFRVGLFRRLGWPILLFSLVLTTTTKGKQTDAARAGRILADQIRSELKLPMSKGVRGREYGDPNALFGLVVLSPKQRTTIRVDTPDNTLRRIAKFERLAHAEDVVLLNGGFHRAVEGKPHTYTPQGLVISNGKIQSQKYEWAEGGVLHVSGATVGITPIRSFTMRPFDAALQSYPLTVEQGANAIRSNDKVLFDRVSVGLCRNGDVIAFGVFRKDTGRALSLFDFADFQLAAAKGLKCDLDVALAMDGGPSAAMYIPATGKWAGNTERDYVPNVLAIARP
jgi:uncharacterized protein YigE (DUF2233 family)